MYNFVIFMQNNRPKFSPPHDGSLDPPLYVASRMPFREAHGTDVNLDAFDGINESTCEHSEANYIAITSVLLSVIRCDVTLSLQSFVLIVFSRSL